MIFSTFCLGESQEIFGSGRGNGPVKFIRSKPPILPGFSQGAGFLHQSQEGLALSLRQPRQPKNYFAAD
jgi:hypothetical protein